MVNLKGKVFLINGVSSWIGHYVVNYLATNFPSLKIVGTARSPSPRAEVIKSNRDTLALLKSHQPDYFLNLARGEEEIDFEAHLGFIEILKNSGHYGYVSSFNACDANLTTSHSEDEKAEAQSDYGKFKARCELALEKSGAAFSIFRFGAVHGWAPNRIARTEAFLQDLAAGKSVPALKGLVQNRLYVGNLAGMMVDVCLAKGQGVFNLGTTDASEEVAFLRQVATAFGYSEDLITEYEDTATNAHMVPKKIWEMFGSKWRKSQNDTIAALANSKELGRYRRSR